MEPYCCCLFSNEKSKQQKYIDRGDEIVEKEMDLVHILKQARRFK